MLLVTKMLKAYCVQLQSSQEIQRVNLLYGSRHYSAGITQHASELRKEIQLFPIEHTIIGTPSMLRYVGLLLMPSLYSFNSVSYQTGDIRRSHYSTQQLDRA